MESGTSGCGNMSQGHEARWGTEYYTSQQGPHSQYLSLKDQLTGSQDLALFLPQLFCKGMPPHGGQDPMLDIQPDHWGPHAPSPEALLALEGEKFAEQGAKLADSGSWLLPWDPHESRERANRYVYTMPCEPGPLEHVPLCPAQSAVPASPAATVPAPRAAGSPWCREGSRIGGGAGR